MGQGYSGVNDFYQLESSSPLFLPPSARRAPSITACLQAGKAGSTFLSKGVAAIILDIRTI
jgi:hypothetical protein